MVPIDVQIPPYTRESAVSFYQMLEQRIQALPGVRSVSYASLIPFTTADLSKIRAFPRELIRFQHIRPSGSFIARGRACGNVHSGAKDYQTGSNESYRVRVIMILLLP